MSALVTMRLLHAVCMFVILPTLLAAPLAIHTLSNDKITVDLCEPGARCCGML